MLNDGTKDFSQKSFLYRVGQKIFFSKVPTGTQGHRVAPALWDTYFMFIDTRWCQAFFWYRQNWIYSFVTVHFNKYKKLYFLHNHFFLYMNSYWGFTKNLQRWLSFFISKYHSHIFPGSKTPFQLKIKSKLDSWQWFMYLQVLLKTTKYRTIITLTFK